MRFTENASGLSVRSFTWTRMDFCAIALLTFSSKRIFLASGAKSWARPELMYAVLLAAIGFAPIRSTFIQPQLFHQRVQAQQTFTTSRSGRVACMETHTKATFFENGLPDEQTLRAALESAFTAIDRV